jgi:hypothetical protein
MNNQRYYLEPIKEGFFPVELSYQSFIKYFLSDEDDLFDWTFWVSYYNNPIDKSYEPIVFLKRINDQVDDLQLIVAEKQYKRLKVLMRKPPLSLTENDRIELIEILNKLPFIQSVFSQLKDKDPKDHPDPEHKTYPGRSTPNSSFFSYPRQDEYGRWYVTKEEVQPKDNINQIMDLLKASGYEVYVKDNELWRRKDTHVNAIELDKNNSDWCLADFKDFKKCENCNTKAKAICAKCKIALFCSSDCAINHLC